MPSLLLDLIHRKMNSDVQAAIKFCKETGGTRLDLGNCNLTTIPDDIKGLKNLEVLILSSEFQTWNPLDDFRKSRWIAERSRNTGPANKINFIPPWFGSALPKLKRLVLAGGHEGKWALRDLNPLKELRNLKELDISNTQVDDLRPLRDLTDLRLLLCYRTSVSDLSPLSNLNLEILQAYNTRITSLQPLFAMFLLQQLVVNQTDIDSLEPIRGCKALTRLDIKRTKIDDRSVDVLAGFKKLQILDLLETRITKLPKLDMPDLLLLDLRKTKIKDLRPLLPLLEKGMEILEVEQGAMRGIMIDRDTPFENPPIEVVLGGKKAVLDYFRAASTQGTNYLYEAKVVIVGAGESGKTTLVRKLKNPNHPVPNKDDKRTEGILIEQYSFRGKVKNIGPDLEMVAHIWDFGGQELYYTTHQLFLTEDTLYILLNDNRKNHTDFYYWLNIVAIRAGDACPILMVFNAKESAQRTISLEDRLFDNFKSLIREPIDVNFIQNDERLTYLRSAIHREFGKLEVLGKELPSYWINVRQKLRRRSDDYISKNDFYKICEEERITDVSQMDTLARVLHKLGAILYFPDIMGLKDLVILKPKWCTDAVYKALDEKLVQDKHGRFDKAHLSKIWSEDRYRGKELQLLEIMCQFGLCYQVSDGTQSNYIAPQLLSLNARRCPDLPTKDLLRYRYKYEFMPSGIITLFIARMSQHIHENYVWRNGVTLCWSDGTLAEVTENQLAREIDIKLSGPDKKRRLLDIQEKLFEIQKMFRGLKYKELIPCNCRDCIGSDSPTLFEISQLEAHKQLDIPVVCTNISTKGLSAQHLLEGIFENKNSVVAEAERLFKNGELLDAIQRLSRLGEARDLGVTNLESQYNSWQQEKTKGTLSEAQIILERNKLADSIRFIIESLKNQN